MSDPAILDEAVRRTSNGSWTALREICEAHLWSGQQPGWRRFHAIRAEYRRLIAEREAK